MTINPDKPFRICWELLGIIVIMWVTMSLPFKIAFLNDHIDDHDPNFVLQVFVDLFFFTDVILNFFTAYYDKNDALIKDGKRIKVRAPCVRRMSV
ncbi:MAG: hypothetical protein EOO65_04225 [Methanosarcinales archaeon]|nr:MAG: hypothetical protein EOO65_04225 [Methanosarcinales archaeon]